MKTDAVFKRAYNDALDLVIKLRDGDRLPSENALSAKLGVSRTTVRKVLATLTERGIIAGSGRHRYARAVQNAMQRYPVSETVPDGGAGGTALHGMDAARRRPAREPRSTSFSWRASSASPPPASASFSIASSASD